MVIVIMVTIIFVRNPILLVISWKGLSVFVKKKYVLRQFWGCCVLQLPHIPHVIFCLQSHERLCKLYFIVVINLYWFSRWFIFFVFEIIYLFHALFSLFII